MLTGSGKNSVLVIGPFPSPLHGLSQATQKMAEALATVNARVVRVDVAPGRGESLYARFADLLTRYISAIWKLISHIGGRQVPVCYIALSGGPRQAIDFVFIGIARVLGYRIVIHHHSFAYINSYSRLTNLLVKTAGHRATHIVLCERMAHGLRTRYAESLKYIVLSNLRATIAPAQPSARRGPPRIVGYLSNITVEKGFDQFLRIIEAARAAGIPIEGKIAGPFVDRHSEHLLADAKNRGLPIEYLGSLYGDAKDRFFADIDLFIFPTRYANEAEPFVLIEALAAGVPVISAPRGCIPDLVRHNVGYLLADDDVDSAVSLISSAFRNPDQFDRMRADARNLFDSLARENEKYWQDFIGLFRPAPSGSK